MAAIGRPAAISLRTCGKEAGPRLARTVLGVYPAAMAAPIDSRAALVDAVARDIDALCEIVALDVGEPAADLRDEVVLALTLLATPEERRPIGEEAAAQLRERGRQAAHAGVPADRLLDRFTSLLPAIWDAAVALEPPVPVLRELATWLLRGADLTARAISDGYQSAERSIVARDATARRAFLEELLSTFPDDVQASARLRRLATRYGLDPLAAYRLFVVTPHQGTDDDEAHELADRLGQRIGARSSADRASAAPGLPLPQVLARRGRVVVLARADWPGGARLREALDAMVPGWVAVATTAVDGVGGLPAAMAQASDTVRAAGRLGRGGWIDDPDDLAVERLLLLDDVLLAAVVAHELGPLLAVPRMGDELVETLRVYFESGENAREAARRLHLANRTVTYRLARIAEALGRPLDGEMRNRLSVALLAYRIAAARATVG